MNKWICSSCHKRMCEIEVRFFVSATEPVGCLYKEPNPFWEFIKTH